MEQRALEGLLLLPASPARPLLRQGARRTGRSSRCWAIALVPLMVVLYDAATAAALGPARVILLGAAGLSAPGHALRGHDVQARARQTLLPLLLFPLVVPVLLASVKATSLLILGDPMGQLRSWTLLLVCFDAIHWSLCGLLFGRVVED